MHVRRNSLVLFMTTACLACGDELPPDQHDDFRTAEQPLTATQEYRFVEVLQDTYIVENSPNTNSNFEGSSRMDVEDAAGAREYSLVRFDPNQIRAAAGANVVVRADLVVTRTAPGLSTVSAHRIESFWDSLLVTWTSRPSFAPVAADTVPTSSSELVLNVSADVVNFLSGNQQHRGWVLIGACAACGDDEASFSTQEGGSPALLRLTVERHLFRDTHSFPFDRDTYYNGYFPTGHEEEPYISV